MLDCLHIQHIVILTFCYPIQVKVKKYIEIPDVTGVPDHLAAKQAWDAHRKRNNSIIIDLFYVSHAYNLWGMF